VRKHLLTVLLFLGVVAATLVVTLGGIYTWVAIQQRNQAGMAAVNVIRQVQEGCAVSVKPAPAPPAAPQPQPQQQEEEVPN
jgi:hypothetical protein